MGNLQELQKIKRRNRVTLVSLMIAVAVLAVCCLFAGSSNMTVAQGLQALNLSSLLYFSYYKSNSYSFKKKL